jgi:hypothetical protein
MSCNGLVQVVYLGEKVQKKGNGVGGLDSGSSGIPLDYSSKESCVERYPLFVSVLS